MCVCAYREGPKATSNLHQSSGAVQFIASLSPLLLLLLQLLLLLGGGSCRKRRSGGGSSCCSVVSANGAEMDDNEKEEGRRRKRKKLKSEECREVRQSGTQGDENKQNRAEQSTVHRHKRCSMSY